MKPLHLIATCVLVSAVALTQAQAGERYFVESPGPERLGELLGAKPTSIGRNIVLPATGQSIISGSSAGQKSQQQSPQTGLKPARAKAANAAIRDCAVDQDLLLNLGVYFALGSSKIQESSYGLIADLAETMRRDPDLKLNISGHTDITGNDHINVPLSVDRALAVAERLVKHHEITADRLRAVGYAATRLCYPDAPKHPRNRRVAVARQ